MRFGKTIMLAILTMGMAMNASAQPASPPAGGRAIRALPGPVRTYVDLQRETGLSKPAALAYGKMAVDVAAKDWPTAINFRCNASGGHVVSNIAPPPATKVFDNLYYVGDSDVSSWALVTSDGIILIETLTTEEDARKFIVEGLKSVGLDAKNVKYIIISHEHGDHYGGAPLIKSLSGARVGMSAAAWKGMEAPARGPLARSPKPAKDAVLVDGQAVTVGDTTVTIVETPGHTPGTLSLIIPVKEGGRTHYAAFWGGNGFPDSVADRKTFLKSVDHFTEYTDRYNVDVELAVHADADDLMARLKKRRAGGPNPFLVGREAYLRYEEVYRLCSRARMAQRGDE